MPDTTRYSQWDAEFDRYGLDGPVPPLPAAYVPEPRFGPEYTCRVDEIPAPRFHPSPLADSAPCVPAEVRATLVMAGAFVMIAIFFCGGGEWLAGLMGWRP